MRRSAAAVLALCWVDALRPAMPPPRPRTSGGRRAVVRNVSGHVPAGATAVLEMRRVGDVTYDEIGDDGDEDVMEDDDGTA